MSCDFSTWAADVRRLIEAVDGLREVAGRVGVAPPDGAEWFELLRLKLLPQLQLPPLLVVAVVGGTNIGKSLIFNHLVGEEASAVSPLASGTRHPVCLVPRQAADPAVLEQLFQPFELLPWSSPEEALGRSDDNLLFWRIGANVADRLVLLDTPDIDSDAMANWERARAVREAADVLLAVLTQQKYNDAAVKQFFREAARADKAVIVLFNQCDLVGDRPYWHEWLQTFVTETGTRPERVYVLPNDRNAAKDRRLPFHDVGADGRGELGPPGDLREELARLHFDAIKRRTFRGAMAHVLDPRRGATAYLETLRGASEAFASRLKAVVSLGDKEVDWPTLPPRLLADEIRDWWDQRRHPASRKVHGFYRKIGKAVVGLADRLRTRPAVDPLADFKSREQAAIVKEVGRTYEELERLAAAGDELLRPRLERLLDGRSRQQQIAAVKAAHDALTTMDESYRVAIHRQLDQWRADNPRTAALLKWLDTAGAAVRPMVTVALGWTGFAAGADMLVHPATEAAIQTAAHATVEAAAAAGTVVVVDGAVAGGHEGAVGWAARLFYTLQAGYVARRKAWLNQWQLGMLAPLIEDLRQSAEVPKLPAFAEAEAILARLRSR